MASFRIHEDQENTALGLRKDADVFSAATQRRALGDLSQFACHQNRSLKHAGMTNGPCKPQDENRTVRQIKNEKNIVPPVAQFRAFSVYEDKPTEIEVKKREPTFKPFVAKEIRKDNFFINAAENVKALCAQVEKKKEPELKKEAVPIRLALQEKKDVEKDNLVESPMSVVDTSILSMSISKNESQILEENDEDTTTAQTDREMFFHVVEYRQDIYDYMRSIEVKNRANPRYMRKQPDITHVMRSILIDWLVEVCDEYGQQSETLHLAVSYVDRFLSYMSVVRTKLQLVGTAATYIASKYEEVYPPEVSEFVYITDDTYTKREVLRMEHLILKVLSFDLSTPTALAFLSHFCITNGYSKKIFHLAAYIAELSLLEAEPYLQFKPSVIAAAALATARHCLLCERDNCTQRVSEEQPLHQECTNVAWPAELAAHSGYSMSDLSLCARELSRSHAHAPHQPYQAIPDKYKNNKFDGVSTIEAKPMFPVAKYQPPAAARPPPETKAS
ncbi:cyclin-A2 [Pararge aegeria]|uniref:Jg11218 protein n=2 Tax=Pararge aegeria TaxID=116150 RepID=A0A8S4RJ00_9NEOP|nr:cyclin-A2 [Pararge aegeria]CAH2237248.1 jg11218 [Pararge aegeria aegeria]